MNHIVMGESEHEHSMRRERLVRALVHAGTDLEYHIELAPDLLVELAQVMGWEDQLPGAGFVRMRVVNQLMGTDQLGWVPVDQYEKTKAHWAMESNSPVEVTMLAGPGESESEVSD